MSKSFSYDIQMFNIWLNGSEYNANPKLEELFQINMEYKMTQWDLYTYEDTIDHMTKKEQIERAQDIQELVRYIELVKEKIADLDRKRRQVLTEVLSYNFNFDIERHITTDPFATDDDDED